YAISSVNEGKYRVFGASLMEAFGSHGQTTPENMTPLSENDLLLKSLVERRNAKLAERMRQQQETMHRIAGNLNQVMAPLVTNGQVTVSETSRGVVLDINASALFNQGEAELQSASLKTLTEVANILGPG